MKEINYVLVPQRIFLDTNVLQYFQDFGEFIFDNYRKTDKYLVSTQGKKILKNSKLYKEIEALRVLLLGIDRTNIEFAISENTFAEVQKKQDSGYTQWFFEMWDYWQNIFQGYEKGIVTDRDKLRRFDSDTSLLGRLSKDDSNIIRDAISLNCNAILTVDKFKDLNKDTYSRYKVMILHPTDLWSLLKPFQALYY